MPVPPSDRQSNPRVTNPDFQTTLHIEKKTTSVLRGASPLTSDLKPGVTPPVKDKASFKNLMEVPQASIDLISKGLSQAVRFVSEKLGIDK